MNSVNTTLQIPIPVSLKREAKIVAREQGFSSLQDFVRLILTKLVKREMSVRIGSNEEFISLSESARKRYTKVAEDITRGRNIISAINSKEFLKKLRA
jgi:hypothetical protein